MRKLLRNANIRTKLIISIAAASAAAFVIGLCGLWNIFRMNDTIHFNDANIVKPLVSLNRITFNVSQIKVLTRDILLAQDNASQEERFDIIRGYQEDLRNNINIYLDTLISNGNQASAEYALVSQLSIKVSDWTSHMENVVRISFNGENEAALAQLYGIVLPKGVAINDQVDQLVVYNESQATVNRLAAQKSFLSSTALIGVLLLLGITITIILGAWITRSITKSVSQIVRSAESFADGRLDFTQEELPDDEMGQIARALKRMADSITSLIADNYKIIVDAGAGQLDTRADLSGYKGDYRQILQGINLTFETFCRHLDVVPVAISFFSLSERLVYGNKVMHEMLDRCGFTASDESLLSQILTSGESDRLPERAAALFSGTEDAPSLTITVALWDKSSQETYAYALTFHRVFGAGAEDGKASCVMLTMVDVTEITNSKIKAEQANRTKTEFLSHMSHENRTPMNAIIGMAQMARRTEKPEKVRECINQIESSSHHLIGVLNDVLDMSKIEAGKLTLSEEETSLEENTRLVISITQSKDNDRDINLIHELDIQNDVVLVDSLRLNQVLINLLSNAFKFSPDRSQIKLSVSEVPEGDWSVYLFSVADQGIGMTEEQISRLFQSFEQADVSISKRFGGTGLGLSISKSIIEMMNGRIWVESEVGQGSTFSFTVRLKIVSPAERTAERPLPVPAQGEEIAPYDFSQLRALVVDDIDINRLILITLIADTGIQIEEAGNGREAVNLFGNSPSGYFDLILMDLQMPEMDGCEATRVIRAMNRSDAKTVAIVALTANVIKEDVDLALDAGMDGHIAKPVDLQTALQTIQRLCLEK